jgi:hypothetical protein
VIDDPTKLASFIQPAEKDVSPANVLHRQLTGALCAKPEESSAEESMKLLKDESPVDPASPIELQKSPASKSSLTEAVVTLDEGSTKDKKVMASMIERRDNLLSKGLVESPGHSSKSIVISIEMMWKLNYPCFVFCVNENGQRFIWLVGHAGMRGSAASNWLN